jgi:hypothetical protein
LKRAYDASPVDRLDDAGVTIAFTNDSSSQRRKSSIKPIIEALASLPEGYDGEVPLGEKKLSKTADYMVVSRGFSDGPDFCVSDCGSFADVTEQTIRRKFEKQYTTTSPLELLAYYHLHPSNFGTGWAPRLSAVERMIQLQLSQFRRVWVFNIRTSGVEWVYPPTRGGKSKG